MTTYSALTTLAGEAPARALGEAMERLGPEPTGVGVFEIEDGSGLWEVGGYFAEPPDAAGLALLAAAFGARPFAVSEVPDTDWVAKVRRELTPVEAGRFFVYGSHDAHRLPAGRIGLLIEAAMAFGTGHHGTTQGCLEALDALAEEGFAPSKVADIGCGTAVLAMAAARIWDVPVFASDIDPLAVEVARANVEANGLVGRVVYLEAAGFDHPELAEARPFGLVFANILKAPLVDLAPAMATATAPGGRIVLSGLLHNQAPEVTRAYEQSGFAPRDTLKIDAWSTLVMVRAG